MHVLVDSFNFLTDGARNKIGDFTSKGTEDNLLEAGIIFATLSLF